MNKIKILKSGHTVDENRCKKEDEFQMSIMPNLNTTLVTLNPKKWRLLSGFLPYADQIYDFEIRSTDVMILSFPKCGSIWMSEIIWTMMKNQNFDSPMKDLTTMIRIPAIPMDHQWEAQRSIVTEAVKKVYPDIDETKGPLFEAGRLTKDPRVLRSHLPICFMPKNMIDKCKVICIMRNPKDVIISFKHYSALVKSLSFCGTLDDLIDAFLQNIMAFGPFWEYYKEAWSYRNHPNFHWVYFEDMKADIKSEMNKLNDFLDRGFDDNKMEEIIKYTSFEEMKKREPLYGQFKKGDENLLTRSEVEKKDGTFFRQGKAGKWKDVLTVSQNERIDKWISDNTQDVDFKIKY